MPEGAPLPKVEATRGSGARVVPHGICVEDAVSEALVQAEKTGAVFIHPCDHPDVVAGQGTLGFQIVEQCPHVRTVIVPIGDGGLAAGVAVAVKDLDTRSASSAAGPRPWRRIWPRWPPGIRCRSRPGRPWPTGSRSAGRGNIPFAILSELADRVVTVSEESLSQGLLLSLERAKQVVEPAGATGVAALHEHTRDFVPPVVILSGGNIDPLLLSKLLRRGRPLPGVPLPAARLSRVAGQAAG
jgi:threonine dehydratase